MNKANHTIIFEVLTLDLTNLAVLPSNFNSQYNYQIVHTYDPFINRTKRIKLTTTKKVITI